jgi:hypothetical protein
LANLRIAADGGRSIAHQIRAEGTTTIHHVGDDSRPARQSS